MEIDIIKDFLRSQEWQFTEVEDKNILLFGIGGKNGNFKCIVDLIADEKRLIFFSVPENNTPEDKKQDMLLLLNNLNCRLFFGSFEMDLQDGKVKFKTSISFNHFELNQNFVEELILSNIVTVDKCLPSIIGLMLGKMSVEKALELSAQEE